MAKKIEYIRRDEAIRYAQWEGDYKVVMRLEEMKAADVHPIKRGKWEENAGYGGWGDTIYQCSECNIEFTCETGIDIDWNYCPNCGARMIKDGDTE